MPGAIVPLADAAKKRARGPVLHVNTGVTWDGVKCDESTRAASQSILSRRAQSRHQSHAIGDRADTSDLLPSSACCSPLRKPPRRKVHVLRMPGQATSKGRIPSESTKCRDARHKVFIQAMATKTLDHDLMRLFHEATDAGFGAGGGAQRGPSPPPPSYSPPPPSSTTAIRNA